MGDNQSGDKRIGDYMLLAEIGKGSMATVYRSVIRDGAEEVALKVLSPHFAHQETYLERLQAQVAAVNDLNHPHIMPIYETGVHKGKVYLVMPLLAGGTLQNKLAQNGSLSPIQLEPIVTQIAAALDAAHAVAVFHRDLKPSNILFDNAGNAIVSDFGLIQFVDTTLHASGLPGTLVYMSPEQFTGTTIDGRTDQYSLAIIIFEALTGQVPFSGNMTQLMFKQVHKPPPLHRLPNESVATVLRRALAKNPEDRFETVTALAAAWQQAAGSGQSDTATEAVAATRHLRRSDIIRDPEATFVVEPPAKSKPTTASPAINEAESAAAAEWPPPLAADDAEPVIIPGAGGELESEPKRWWLLPRSGVWLLFVILLVLLAIGLAWQYWPARNDIMLETAAIVPDNVPAIMIVNTSPQATWQMGDTSGTLTIDSRLPWPDAEAPLRLLTAGGPAALALPGGLAVHLGPESSIIFRLLPNAPQSGQLLLEITQGRIAVVAQGGEATVETSLNSVAEVTAGTMGVGYAEEPFLFEVDCFSGVCSVTDLDVTATLTAGERTYLAGGVLVAPDPVRHELYDFTTAVATATATPFITATPTPTFTIPPTLTPIASPSPSPSPSATSTPTPTATVAPAPVVRTAPQITQYTCNQPGNFHRGNLITFTWTWADQLRGNEYLEVRVGPQGGSAAVMRSVGAATQPQGNQWSLSVAAEQFFNPDFYDYSWEVVLVQPGGTTPLVIVRSASGCIRVEP